MRQAVLDQLKQAEAQLQGLGQTEAEASPELLAELQTLTTTKAQALAQLHEAQAQRRVHEIQEHPDGEKTAAAALLGCCAALFL